MHVHKLEINNFRGFWGKHNNLFFSPRINVFVGVNGAGKTSLLDLLAIFLNQFSIKLVGNSNKDYEYALSQLDINIDEKETRNRIYFKTNLLYVENFFDDKNEIELTWEIVKDSQGSRNSYSEIKEYVGTFHDFILENKDCCVPILKYFQSQRLTNEKSRFLNSTKKYLGEQLKAYDDAFNKSNDFNQFIQWFIEEENIENREKIARKDFNHENPILSIIRMAINIFFKGFKSDLYNNFRIEDRTEMSKLSEKSSLVIDKNSKTYNLKQLSDGEKILILMVSDIAHRLAIANPNAKNALDGLGIILIDEIDLHLHPAWQRAVIPCFLNTFPNLQFFITSHSPQVLGSLENEYVFEIKDFKLSKLNAYTKGRDTNSILYDVFDVCERDELYKNELELLYNYIEINDKESAKSQLEKLSKLWGSTDREIVRANMYYEDLIE